jgi:hypothetical protein
MGTSRAPSSSTKQGVSIRTRLILSVGERERPAGGRTAKPRSNCRLTFDRGTVKPRVGKFTVTGSLSTPRFLHRAHMLASAKVLIVAGNHFGSIASAGLYDPMDGTFSSTASLNTPRQGHASALLTNRQGLAVGGYESQLGNYGVNWPAQTSSTGAPLFLPEIRRDHSAEWQCRRKGPAFGAPELVPVRICRMLVVSRRTRR